MDARYAEAIRNLRQRIGEADHRGQPDANAASLATADTAGRPSVRTVYLQFSEDGNPVFFVNKKSGKGKQLEVNPRVALCLFWPQLKEQATLEGDVTPLDDATADDVWSHRPRDSALAAWVSHQELPDGDTAHLHQDVKEAKRIFDFEAVPRPRHWVGYRVDPDRIEFWAASWRRLSGRHLYRRAEDGTWELTTQEP